MNIGIHLFDVMIWLFGGVSEIENAARISNGCRSGGWYDTEGMVEFLAAAKAFFDPMALLVLTREDAGRFSDLCGRYRVCRAVDGAI